MHFKIASRIKIKVSPLIQRARGRKVKFLCYINGSKAAKNSNTQLGHQQQQGQQRQQEQRWHYKIDFEDCIQEK